MSDIKDKLERSLVSLEKRRAHCWDMVSVYTESKDAHGVMDMGSELEALNRAIDEIKKVIG